jgi:hypothetical protein
MFKLRENILLLGICLSAHAICAQVVTYPAPSQMPASLQYEVSITQNGKKVKSFVHVSEAQFPEKNRSKNTAYSIFSFSGKITVTVTKLDTAFSNCKILPSSYRIPALKKGNTVSFTLDKPRNIAVEFDGSQAYPLLIFANPLEKNVPQKTDVNVLYYGPGYHDKEDTVFLKANQTLYVAGGAVLSAHVVGYNAHHAKIMGRGIISGRRFGHTHGKLIHFPGNQSTDLYFEGFTMVDAPGYYITTGGKRTHAKNVKGLGWWFNTDGFSFGEDGLTEDCFLKCNDDAIKLYRSGNKVYRTTIWQMENGAPFQISWNMNSNNSGFVVKDCDVIRCDHQWENPNEAVFDAIHGGSGHMSNYLFEDIRVENSDWKLVSLQIMKNRWAKADTLGKISNVTFRNISVTTSNGKPMKRLSVLNGFDSVSAISNITFENVSINGVYLKNAEQGRVSINDRSVKHVQFVVTKEDLPVSLRHPPLKELSNPIRNGLNSYGQKDFHIYQENGWYYLVATEYTNTYWPKRGVMLYKSADMVNWQEEKLLINRYSLPDSVWYKDVWSAPELHSVNGSYVLTFNCGNNMLRPYKKLGFGYAVSDKITGPYRIITDDKPLFEGYNASLFTEGDSVYVYFDVDGVFYYTTLNPGKAAIHHAPIEMLGASTLKDKYKFLDAPSVFKSGKYYFLLLTQFYAGYIERIRYMVADTPVGPWRFVQEEPLYTFLEAEANEQLQMPYPKPNAFAPPTQVVFSHSVFKGSNGNLFMAYHSSEKYAEPYLCIEPIEIKDNQIIIPTAKAKTQHIK